MQISDKIIGLLNKRIQEEELSGRLYYAMSRWLENTGYFHSAKVWKKSAADEMSHAEWSYSYLLGLGILPNTPELTSPPTVFDNLRDIIEKTYDHEVVVTQQCNALAKACLEEGDMLTFEFVQAKYMSEQAEELERVTNYKDLLRVYDNGDLLSMALLDKEFSKYE